MQVPIGNHLYAVAVGNCDAEQSAAAIDHAARQITISHRVPPSSVLTVTAAAVATAWKETVIAYGEQLEFAWRSFDAMTEATDELLEGEITEDEAGDVFAAFDRLRRLGVRFDPPFAVKVEQARGLAKYARHQGYAGGRKVEHWVSSESFIDDADDPDADRDDSVLENDDPDLDLDRSDDRPAISVYKRPAPTPAQIFDALALHGVCFAERFEWHTSMAFQVGPWKYTARVVDDLNVDAAPMHGLAVYGSKEILLSSKLHPEKRLDTLLHELRHCWGFHVPRPSNDEEEADLSATITAAFVNDFDAQGGRTTLRLLQPTPCTTPPPTGRIAKLPASAPFDNKLFVDRDGRPVPISSSDDAPNEIIFGVDGAAVHFGLPAKSLVALYDTFMACKPLASDKQREPKMLFRRYGDRFVPLHPESSHEPDGWNILTVEDYAAATGRTVESAEQKWRAFWPDNILDAKYRFRERNGVPVAVADHKPPAPDIMGLEETAAITGLELHVLRMVWDAKFGGEDGDDEAEVDDRARRSPEQVYPSSESSAADSLSWRNNRQKAVIRANDFGRLPDADFEWFLAAATEQGLDPFKREVKCDFFYNESSKRMDLRLIVSLDKLRSIAHASGAYGGIRVVSEPPNGIWPTRSTCIVTRFVGGQRCEFEATAGFDDYYPGENSGTEWDNNPRACLDECAERLALSRAFPISERRATGETAGTRGQEPGARAKAVPEQFHNPITPEVERIRDTPIGSLSAQFLAVANFIDDAIEGLAGADMDSEAAGMGTLDGRELFQLLQKAHQLAMDEFGVHMTREHRPRTHFRGVEFERGKVFERERREAMRAGRTAAAQPGSRQGVTSA